jgi:carbon starvation protein
LFGTTNQLLASLTLLVATIYLLQRGRNWLVTGIPMLLMTLTTLVAMVRNLVGFWNAGQTLLLCVGALLLALAVGVVVEGARCFISTRRSGRRAESMAVFENQPPLSS